MLVRRRELAEAEAAEKDALKEEEEAREAQASLEKELQEADEARIVLEKEQMEAEEAAAVELAGAVGEQAGPAVASVSPEGNEVEEPDVRGDGTAPVDGAHPKRLKPKKGGGYKVSGLRDGDKKGTTRTIHFKYEVVQHLRLLQARLTLLRLFAQTLDLRT